MGTFAPDYHRRLTTDKNSRGRFTYQYTAAAGCVSNRAAGSPFISTLGEPETMVDGEWPRFGQFVLSPSLAAGKMGTQKRLD